MKPVKSKEFEEVKLVIRNYKGNDVLFVVGEGGDLKMLPNQSTEGHFYYIGSNPRWKTFRCSLLVDNNTVSQGAPIQDKDGE